jgi:hypothetical protein
MNPDFSLPGNPVKRTGISLGDFEQAMDLLGLRNPDPATYALLSVHIAEGHIEATWAQRVQIGTAS